MALTRAAWLLLAWLGVASGLRAETERAVDFDRDVAPLLSRRCLDCHGGADPKGGLDLSHRGRAAKGGDSGTAVTPGDLSASELWQRVDRDEMPPKKPLTADEKRVLRSWIESGARWGTDPIDPYRFTTEARAGYDWWSLRPVHRPEPPAISGDVQAWAESGNAIDRFVAAKLTDQKLAPSPEADRRTLLRRVTFDLIGLPPTAAEIEAFENDREPGAYERVVERLLGSPHFGERWARHWLDIVRFGESQGFERDRLRANSWPYRDWVIQAFNADLPYDEFARRQIAGDVLSPGDVPSLFATGFLVAGAYDEVGQNQQSATMRAVVRQDELEDIIGTTGQTFLGLTVNCARCHDHKFDPIRQTEYYQFAAALAGVRHGERGYQTDEIRTEIAALQMRREEIETARRNLEEPVLAAIRLARAENHPVPPTPMARWDFDGDFQDRIGTLHGAPHGKARTEGGKLVLDGKGSYVSTAPVPRELRAKTLEAWVQPADLGQRGGGVLSVQTTDGVLFDSIVYAERDASQWMAGSNGFVRTESFQGPAETEPQLVHVAIVYGEDGTVTGYRNGLPYGRPYESPGLQGFPAGATEILFGLRHGTSSGGNRLFSGAIETAQLYDRALTAEEVAASAGRTDLVTSEELAGAMSPEQRAAREVLIKELKRVDSRLKTLRSNSVYCVNPRSPEPTHLLLRGNPGSPAEIVRPAGIASLGATAADFGLSADAPEGERRRHLAEWIASRENPLFARVIVNRLWQYHFGRGLVASSNDFGFNGGLPTHPELLDWLASELVDAKWSLKHVHRLIVQSATYRQGSRLRREGLSVDADNRFHWRHTPQRLEAETLRDTILTASGELNPKVGGPPYQDFRTYTFNSQFYEMQDPVGPEFNRRTVYRTWIRSARSPLLDVFDCPDPSTTAPRRPVTTTPVQSLSLLNNSFILRMSDTMAARVTAECGDDRPRQVAQAYRRAYGREPAGEELARAETFVQQYGLPALCRVLFNSNEFLFVD
ncbi:DUF1553 domain-containing protein [Planctomyces sp. SH-PL14]|uniref:DUF1553 domain-containing protein n=1 Tax=Planctomyces sp. SH-PL14 TaxID=1632864 RepID=UPI00078C8BC1|nr:DUF1553 domain-containing protein [Planctomyces sp. SH-PL14]AMV17823.1 Planctomycete cytochrome C [Planctomyces sp. SH-PL14]